MHLEKIINPNLLEMIPMNYRKIQIRIQSKNHLRQCQDHCQVKDDWQVPIVHKKTVMIKISIKLINLKGQKKGMNLYPNLLKNKFQKM